MKRNYYGSTLGGLYSIHAFGSKAERDQWVEARWDGRAAEDGDSALRLAREAGELMLHGGARVPRSWRGARHLVWDYERTDDPDVARAYLAY